MTIRIEVICPDYTFIVSEFYTQLDHLYVIAHYIETLEFFEDDFIVYHDGIPVQWNLGWPNE
jgi:hypothetical protein